MREGESAREEERAGRGGFQRRLVGLVVLQLTLKRGWVYSLGGEGALVLTWARRTGAAETGTRAPQHKALC